MQPNLGVNKNFSGRSKPYATTTTKSGLSFLNWRNTSSCFKVEGVIVFKFNSFAFFSTGESFVFIPLPLGRAGCE